MNPTTARLATGQVVDATIGVIRASRLDRPAGATALLSCANLGDPPYQAAVDMTFRLPQRNSVGYLRDVADAMVRAGWVEASVTGEHFGYVLTRDGVMATVYRNTERTDLATMRLHGECRVTGDHRADASVWSDVTGQLRPYR